MTETLKTSQELLDSITDNEQQLNTAQDIRDIIFSITGVGAKTSGTEAEPVAADLAVPKGLELISPRRYRVLPGGDGPYLFMAQGNGAITGDPGAEYLVRSAIVVNDDAESPNYINKAYFKVDLGDKNYLNVWDSHNVVGGDEISLEYYVGGGQSLNNVEYMYIGVRVG